MENFFTQQVERIDRLMRIVEANIPHDLATGLLTVDVIMFACQSIWHLKDWILNDPDFGATDKEKLKQKFTTLVACLSVPIWLTVQNICR